jgi:hypothetical protein
MKVYLIMFMSLFCASHILGQETMLEGISEVKALKRGNTYTIKWAGTKENEVYSLRLVKDGSIVQEWTEQSLKGIYKIEIPPKLRPGKNYAFTLVSEASSESANANSIIIQRKVPLSLKLASAGVAGLGLILVLLAEKAEPIANNPQAPNLD